MISMYVFLYISVILFIFCFCSCTIFVFFFCFTFGKVDFELIHKMLGTQSRFVQRPQKKPDTMAEVVDMFYTFVFGDTEFSVPRRYVDLVPKGIGAQGMVV